ncbi:MAG: pyridoxamine 5'-phosphate oxidase family protein [Oryzihumus sp.]
MSVKVDLEELAATLRDFGSGYLLTVTDDQRSHAVAVSPVGDGEGLRVEGLGNGTRANLTVRPAVTLLFPPREPGGYSLIVDGTAEPQGEGALVVPTHAVLHRPADHAAGGTATSSCGNDCVPVAEA